jgi:hypothetical protein
LGPLCVCCVCKLVTGTKERSGRGKKALELAARVDCSIDRSIDRPPRRRVHRNGRYSSRQQQQRRAACGPRRPPRSVVLCGWRRRNEWRLIVGEQQSTRQAASWPSTHPIKLWNQWGLVCSSIGSTGEWFGWTPLRALPPRTDHHPTNHSGEGSQRASGGGGARSEERPWGLALPQCRLAKLAGRPWVVGAACDIHRLGGCLNGSVRCLPEGGWGASGAAVLTDLIDGLPQQPPTKQQQPDDFHAHALLTPQH